MNPKKSFQDLIFALQTFWSNQGCAILQPYDVEMGAGTFHPATTLHTLGPEPWNVAFIQPSRRPTDGRYGQNPNRLQKFHQFQVIMKPSPENSQDLCLQSLKAIGIDPTKNDIRFVEDDWESPTLGAAGLGWEVWCNGLEIVQYTYFQQMGGIACNPVSLELTYGLERLAILLQEKIHFSDIVWNSPLKGEEDKKLTYGDIYLTSEEEFSAFNFEKVSVPLLRQEFEYYEKEIEKLLSDKLPLPAYEYCIKASHLFNLMDARGGISVLERAAYIKRIRDLAKGCCKSWVEKGENKKKERCF